MFFKLFYDHETVEQLKQMYLELFDEVDRAYNAWDLSVDSFKQKLMSMPENDEKKQDLLQRLSNFINALTFNPYQPSNSSPYSIW